MLHHICALSLLILGAVASNNINTGVSSNYIIYAFGSGSTQTYFPFAMNKCQPSGLTGGSAYKFTCAADHNSVTLQLYGTTDCSGSSTSSMINTTYYGPDTTVYRTYPGAFRCNGTSDYADINFGVSSGTCDAIASATNIQASINVCTRVPAPAGSPLTYVYLKVYCNYESAELQYYTDGACSGVANNGSAFKVSHANATCGYMFTFTTGVDIYGEVNNCTQNSTGGMTKTPSPTTMQSSFARTSFTGIISCLMVLIITMYL